MIPESHGERGPVSEVTVDAALARAQQSVPDCIAVGYVDTNTGTLLGARTVHSNDALAASDVFQGDGVMMVAKILRDGKREPDTGAFDFREVVVFSEKLVQVFVKSRTKSDRAMIFVCHACVNIRTLLVRSRSCLGELEHDV